MVSGRCFIAKYAKTHEEPTIIDFKKNRRCAVKGCWTIAARFPERSGTKTAKIITGTKTIPLVSVLKNKTGRTVLSLSESFLKISYIPSKEAEIRAAKIHIIIALN
jgi:hypothetical protein